MSVQYVHEECLKVGLILYCGDTPLEGRFEPVASGQKVSIALSDRPVALLVVCVEGWHALVSQLSP